MNTIKELRLEKGLSQKQLADKLFVNQTAVSQWERGATFPSQQLAIKLADFFNVTTDYLLGKTDIKEKSTASVKPTDDDIMFALFEGSDDITDEMYDEVKRFAQFVKEKREREKNSK